MNLSTRSDLRPEAMADVPGVCELPLTRAVVQYRDLHEMDSPGGRIEDIGLAVVVEGRYASSAESLDLGSGHVKLLDLSTELVVLDWIYEPTLEHLNALITEVSATGRRDPLRRYAFRLALTILERVGFGPLTRPTFLRIGFRDICRDLDLNEGTSIRIVLGPGRLTRVHMDYDAGALVFRTAFLEPDPMLEYAISDAFSGAALRRLEPVAGGEALSYQVRLPLALSLEEARHNLAAVRRGLAALIARFEPERFRAVGHLLETFGARETLASLHVRGPATRGSTEPDGPDGWHGLDPGRLAHRARAGQAHRGRARRGTRAARSRTLRAAGAGGAARALSGVPSEAGHPPRSHASPRSGAPSLSEGEGGDRRRLHGPPGRADPFLRTSSAIAALRSMGRRRAGQPGRAPGRRGQLGVGAYRRRSGDDGGATAGARGRRLAGPASGVQRRRHVAGIHPLRGSRRRGRPPDGGHLPRRRPGGTPGTLPRLRFADPFRLSPLVPSVIDVFAKKMSRRGRTIRSQPIP